MSTSVEGLSLVTVIALIRKEIAETRTEGEPGQDGAPGAKGERGPKGDTGPAGKQGPKGHDGKQGKAGKDGNDGKDGEDGADGVGIANIEQDVDNAIIVTMTDGESYTIEMPLGQSTEVHYKVNGGSGGGGTVDLSGYVKRPVASKRDGTWLVYRETSDGSVKEWAPVTTDLVATNPDILFRDAKGRFKSTDTVPDLKNQLEVNRWFLEQLEEIEMGDVHVDIDPPDDPTDGDMWYDTVRLELFVYAEGAWLPCSPLGARVEQGEAVQAQIIDQIKVSLEEQATLRNKVGELDSEKAAVEYVDERDATKLDKAGGTMTGDIAMSGKKITGLADPTANAHAATKKYVDSKAGDIDGLQLDVGYRMHATWKYMGDSHQADNLADGEFTIRTEGGAKPIMKIYLAGQDSQGRRWYAWSDNKESYSHSLGAQYCSITDRDGEVRKAGKLVEGTFNNSGNQYVRLTCEYYKSNWAFTVGNYYTINAAGLLPHAHYIDHYEYNPSPRMVAQASNKEEELASVVIGLPMDEVLS